MIRINLLGDQRAAALRERHALVLRLFGMAGFIAIVLAGSLLTGWVLQQRLDALHDIERMKTMELDSLAGRLSQMDGLKQRLDALRTEQATIRHLQARRERPTRMLQVLSQEIDPLQLWLRGVRMDGQTVIVEGTGLSKDDILDLTSKLKQAGVFRDATLVELVADSTPDVPVLRFTLNMQMNGDLVNDADTL